MLSEKASVFIFQRSDWPQGVRTSPIPVNRSAIGMISCNVAVETSYIMVDFNEA